MEQQQQNSPKTRRCVIYTRKSTDEGLEKEFNTLEAQFDSCASYIQSQAPNGWKLINRHYDDGGYSGGTMNRPAVQQLLQDVADGLIDVVVVYKMDRISRSLSDFTELSKLFEKYNVSLVSVTQQIDTSTSMGRMMLNMLMSFAQFERELDSDRVRDKMAAARKKGMWTGGVVPGGYKLDKHKLYVDQEMVERIMFAFTHYAENRSFLDTTRELNKKFGTKSGGKPWNIENVRHLLKSAIVAGKIRDPHTGELYDGQHEAIVPFELWQRVQAYIDSRRKGLAGRRSESKAPLKGIIRCGYCGCAMMPTFSGGKNGGKRHFYYRCYKTHTHRNEKCELKNISAASIEEPVFELIGRLITNEYFLQLAGEDAKISPGEARMFGSAQAELIGSMTDDERRRLVQLFVRTITVKKDGIDIRVKGDGFAKLMGRARLPDMTGNDWKGN